MAGRGRQTGPQKNYGVGLEIPCRGGAFYWAPEIPSELGLAGAIPSICERVHNRAHSFQNGVGLRSRADAEEEQIRELGIESRLSISQPPSRREVRESKTASAPRWGRSAFASMFTFAQRRIAFSDAMPGLGHR